MKNLIITSDYCDIYPGVNLKYFDSLSVDFKLIIYYNLSKWTSIKQQG